MLTAHAADQPVCPPPDLSLCRSVRTAAPASTVARRRAAADPTVAPADTAEATAPFTSDPAANPEAKTAKPAEPAAAAESAVPPRGVPCSKAPSSSLSSLSLSPLPPFPNSRTAPRTTARGAIFWCRVRASSSPGNTGQRPDLWGSITTRRAFMRAVQDFQGTFKQVPVALRC